MNSLATSLLLLAAAASPQEPEPPRLVLQVTVDALRADLPLRHYDQLGTGGFRYLMDEGVHYKNAHYRHANTETIVGHTSLATGSVPAGHGMVGNIWFDRELGRTVYNIEDPDYTLLTAGASVDASTEIDPTQRAAKVEGRSPRAILTSTFSDELSIHSQRRAKVFGVSVKDRGAVSMAGHTGKAFWFSKSTGEFVTSTYYYESYPEWVTAFNGTQPAQAFAGTTWELLGDSAGYVFGELDDQPFETDFPGFGRTFPHPYGEADDKYFTTRLTLGPAGDRLTLDFAKTLLRAEQLGQDEVTDYLSVSFSSNDYVAHIFGASSLELEDNLLHLDRALAELFAEVDEYVGLEHTLIVLSADHGTPEAPELLNDAGYGNAHYFDLPEVEDSAIAKALRDRFGVGERLIESYSHPYIYLDREAIAEADLDQAEVERTIAETLRNAQGIAAAVPSSALRAGQLPTGEIIELVRANYHPKRSGDIYVVFEPYVFINDFDGLVVASTHGSPWRYDTHVPVMFAGAGVPSLDVSRPTTPYDIAATLSMRLGIPAPASCVGEPLPEVLGY